jgi:hypothetical protein
MHHQISGPGNNQSPMKPPTVRTANLIFSELDGEAVVFEETRQEIHRLNPTALAIWHLSDGTRTARQVSTEASSRLGAVVDEQAVRLAWTLLDDRHLLNEPLAADMRVATRTRRSFLKGALVAGIAALPTIASVSAPNAAAAASPGCTGNTNPCSSDAECCSGWCYEGFCLPQ